MGVSLGLRRLVGVLWGLEKGPPSQRAQGYHYSGSLVGVWAPNGYTILFPGLSGLRASGVKRSWGGELPIVSMAYIKDPKR